LFNPIDALPQIETTALTEIPVEATEPVTDAVRHSLVQSLRPDSVADGPSPHFYSTKAFDPALYTLIRDHLPESKYYGGVGGRTGNVRAKKARLALPFTKDRLDTLPSNQMQFWTEMTGYFQSPEFLKLAMSSYGPFLRELRPDLLKPQQFEIRFELLRDATAYGIGPHSDHPQKVMTLLFYLSAGETSEALGTSFYTPRVDGFRCTTGRHHEYKDFNLFKTYAYAPNTVLSFLRTDTSFHGVEVIDVENVQRDVMRWMLWKV
jgi:hypothetical protein